jgi:DNA segregation ATPase FtsK/SpoIIIE, S-DNA-T family
LNEWKKEVRYLYRKYSIPFKELGKETFKFAFPWLSEKISNRYNKQPPIKPVISEVVIDPPKPREIKEVKTTITPKGNFPLSILNDGVMVKEKPEVISKSIQAINQFFTDYKIGAKTIGNTESISNIRYNVKIYNALVSNIKRRCEDLELALGLPENTLSFENHNGYLGIVIPKTKRSTITLKDILTSKEYMEHKAKFKIAIGMDTNNNPIIKDLEELMHILVAGMSGGGKSVFLHVLICSLLFKVSPKELRIVLIDLKQCEFGMYKDIPHLLMEPITKVDKANGCINTLVEEMHKRNELFSKRGVNNLNSYNRVSNEPLPRLVIIIDEFSLMKDQDKLVDLANVARSTGIHIILSTQYPTSEVITGQIKGNLKTSVAFKVKAYQNSQAILGESGAEKLLGNGDMYLSEDGKITRLQSCYIDLKTKNNELDQIVKHLQCKDVDYIEVESQEQLSPLEKRDLDDLPKVIEFVINQGFASINSLRYKGKFGGDNRVRRFIDKIIEYGVISSERDEKTQQYEIIMTLDEFEIKRREWGI